MQAALKLTAPILPGKRIEVCAPELPDSGTVELFIVLPETTASTPDATPKFAGVADYLAALPPRSYTPEEWEQMERQLQEDRNSWDR